MSLANRSSVFVTYLLFAVIGVAWALPGVLLPVLMTRWHLTDMGAGTLLSCFWCGNAFGALTVRGRLARSLMASCALISAGAATLAFANSGMAIVSIFIYGVGIGNAIATISLIRHRLRPSSRGVELVRLNLVWAVGAGAAPAVGFHALAIERPAPFLFVFAACFATAAVWASTFHREEISLESGCGLTLDGWRRLGNVPVALLLLTLAVPGIDGAGASWLVTYSERTGHGLSIAAGTPACLWAGLLLSRLIGGTVGTEVRLRQSESALMATAFAASIILVCWPVGVFLWGGAFLLGFALGPLYPFFLAKVLAIEEMSPIFFLAGISASVITWLTGAIAGWVHSLRAGMGVIVVIAAMAFLLNLKYERTTGSARTSVDVA